MKDQIHLFKTTRFLPLFITQFFGAFNDNIFKNAFLIWFSFDFAMRSNIDPKFMVTIASALFILPFFLFSAIAGQMADKYEKSKLTRIIKFVEIVIMALVCLGFYCQSVNLLLFLLFAMGTHSTFFGPLKYSLLPNHLSDDELVAGNAMIEGGTFLAILLGTILGGILIKVEGGVLLVSCAIMLFSLIGYFASRSIPATKIANKKLKLSFNIFSRTFAIVHFSYQNKRVFKAIMAISWFWFIGASFLSQFPTYSKEIIGGNERIVTLFLAIFSIGIGLGSAMCNNILKGKINNKLLPFAVFGMSLGIFTFYLASNYYVKGENLIGILSFLNSGIYAFLIILGLLIIAICSGLYIVPLYAIMQHYSDNKDLSQIIAANNILNAIFMVFSSLIIITLFKYNFTLLDIFLNLGLVNLLVYFAIKKI